MTARASRGRAALVVIGGALAVFGLASAEWFSARVPGAVQGEVDLSMSGADAVPALGGAALVLLAAGAALGLVGPTGRRVVGVLVSLTGLVSAALVLSAAREPARSLRDAAASATGVGQLPPDAATSPAVWTTLALAGLITLLGAWHVSGRGTWPVPGSRHDRASSLGPRGDADEVVEDPARAWDALSDGTDPS